MTTSFTVMPAAELAQLVATPRIVQVGLAGEQIRRARDRAMRNAKRFVPGL
jgi:hypothetical protein